MPQTMTITVVMSAVPIELKYQLSSRVLKSALT